jgi:hypothetical protein
MNIPTYPGGCVLTATARIPEGLTFEHLRAESPSLTNFEALDDGRYELAIAFTQSDSPEVADGDLHDDLREIFEDLVTLQRIYECKFELQITAAGKHPDPFVLPERVVIILAILQCRIHIRVGN